MRLSTSHRPPRVALVQRELSRFRRPRYLEIGVHAGTTFLNVRAARKVAVDPVRRIRRRSLLKRPIATLRSRFVNCTSDEYFERLDPAEKFDVIFIDGLHRYDQVLRDVEGSLRHLSDGGVVMVHDCFPPNAAAADPNPGPAAASTSGSWCGDVWKAIVHLRATRKDLQVEVLDVDFGIGIVRCGRSQPISIDVREIPGLGYADLTRRPQELLGLRAP